MLKRTSQSLDGNGQCSIHWRLCQRDEQERYGSSMKCLITFQRFTVQAISSLIKHIFFCSFHLL